MANEAAMAVGEISSPCCIAWKEKYVKLKERYSKVEEGRNALRKGLSIFEQQISKMQAENLALKKAYESEKVRADGVSEEKVKESALRTSLESEVGSLKSNILSLQQNPGPSSEHLEKDLIQLRELLSERDTEVCRLKELYENERIRADSEKKKTDSEKKKTEELRKNLKSEKSRADEERKLVDIERKKAEEYKHRLDIVMKETDELKLKLSSETSKSAEAKKKLETELRNRKEDKKRADSSFAKASEQAKLADANLKMAMDEKRRADDLSQQLDKHRQRIEILKKEIAELKSSRKLVDNLLDKEREVVARLEMNKLEDQRKVVEEYKKMAAKEKFRADQLSRELQDNKQRLEDLEKGFHALISSRSFADSHLHSDDRGSKYQTAKMKLLKKQLKLEKMVVKHSKEATELEKARNCILQEELHCLKQEFSEFSKRLSMLDNCFVCCAEGIHDLEKINLKNKQFGLEPYHIHSHIKDGLAQMGAGGETDSFRENIEGSAPLLAVSGGNCTRNVSGINSTLEPLLIGFNRKVLESSAVNSSSTSFSDRPLVGSQERRASGITSAKFAEEEPNLSTAMLRVSCNSKEKCSENHTTIAENSNRKPITGSTAKKGQHQKKRKRSVDVTESIECLHSKGKKCQQQVSEKFSLPHAVLESQTDKSASAERCLLPDVAGNSCSTPARSYKKKKVSFEEQAKFSLNDANKKMLNLKMLAMEESDIRAKSASAVHISETAHDCKDRSDDLEDFEMLVGNDYMKLLYLDNDADEESYRLAVEMPLSPALPEIEHQSSEALESNLASSGHFDVLDMEIDSNTRKLGTLGSSENALLRDFRGNVDTPSLLCGNETDQSKIAHMNISGSLSEVLGMPDASACGNERSKISDGSIDLPSLEGNLASSGHFDVLDMEIGSNTRKPDTLGSSENALLRDFRGNVDTPTLFCGNETDQSKIAHINISGSLSDVLGMPDASACVNERSKISDGSIDLPSSHGIPKCCLVFSDNEKEDSISRVYSATNDFMARFSVASSSNLFVRNIVAFSSGAQDLSTKEKASLLLSLSLHYISETTTKGFANGWDRESVLFIASFAQHISAELSDEKIGMTFVESCSLYDLFALLEDFILHKKVLMFDDLCSGSKPQNNSRINIFVNGSCVSLYGHAASVDLLVAGGILLASLCDAVDYIGFICEASCNILRMSRFDTSFAVTVLHIFAYICGPKYFSIAEYCFVMAVVKSLVMFLKKLNSPGHNSCFPSLAGGLSNIWLDNKCPFSEGTFSMDVIATMLLDNLQKCAWTSARPKDLFDTVHPSIAGEQYDTERTTDVSDNKEVVTLQSVTGGNECLLDDVIALVELVACFMSWDWTVENLVCPLFKMLESCLLEHVPAAILVLLAQLGRFGVSGNGYEDIGVQNMRTQFSGLLCQCNSKTVGLDIQFSIGIALHGLISVNFEEVMEISAEMSEAGSQYHPAICLKKWFSQLSNELQSSFRNVISSSRIQ